MKHNKNHCCHQNSQQQFDYLLWGSVISVAIFYSMHLLFPGIKENIEWFNTLSFSVYELINTIWWGIVVGFIMVGILSKVPREFVIATLGGNAGIIGIMRATLAGVLLDFCSHGILMVGAKLYERGASIGQVMAFLIASPWNSFSLTIILFSLIGFFWTAMFILFSMLIAVLVGLIFDGLVKRNILPSNPQKIDLPANFKFWAEVKKQLQNNRYSVALFLGILRDGVKESRMVIRWIFFGVLLASLVRTLLAPEQFQTFFGPTLVGLGLTIVAATIIEVCSEGSTPIAADLLTRAKAPGNGFAFLMTGVATDYTEVMVLKDTTKSWKIALFLPLITVPQVILVAWVMNALSVN